MLISHTPLSQRRNPSGFLTISILVFLQLICSDSFGQTNTFHAGAREAALANSAVAIGSEWSMYYNPAGMALMSAPSVGINYTNQYMLEELSTTSFTGIVPVANGGFGVAVSYFGTSTYNQQKYSLGYSHHLGKLFSAGIVLDYYSANLPEPYEPSGALSGEIGILAKPLDNLSIGCHLSNPTNSKYKEYISENIASFFALGTAWQNDILLISSQVNVDRDKETTLSLGSEVYIIPNMAVRIGASNDEQYQYTFGVGYNNKRFKGDIAFTRHPVLGFSSHISFNYTFSGK